MIGLVITLAGGALMLWALFGLPDNALAILGVGAVAIFVGIFVIGPVIARPLSRFIGAPLPKVRGMTGTLARENAMRNPRRTAATASALMIGVALVGFITIFAASAKASISQHARPGAADRLHRHERQRDRSAVAAAGHRRGDGRAARARRGVGRSLRDDGARRSSCSS